MVDQLFGSKTRVKLLNLFYGNANRSYYVREITRTIDEQINSVRRELANLLSIGIIKSDTNNNRLYYEVDQSYEYYQPLFTMFGSGAPSEDGVGSAEGEGHALKALGNIELAILTGQITRDDRSGIDLLLVGDLNQTQVTNYVMELETKEGKELRFTVMDGDEFRYRQEVNDRFLTQVLSSKLQVLVDKSHLIKPKPAKKKKQELEEEEK